MNRDPNQNVKDRLLVIIDELGRQAAVGSAYGNSELAFHDEMKQLREYVEYAGEFGVAYESIVASIEGHPFTLSNSAAIALLELGLIMKYKTDRLEDRHFDIR